MYFLCSLFLQVDIYNSMYTQLFFFLICFKISEALSLHLELNEQLFSNPTSSLKQPFCPLYISNYVSFQCYVMQSGSWLYCLKQGFACTERSVNTSLSAPVTTEMKQLLFSCLWTSLLSYYQKKKTSIIIFFHDHVLTFSDSFFFLHTFFVIPDLIITMAVC